MILFKGFCQVCNKIEIPQIANRNYLKVGSITPSNNNEISNEFKFTKKEQNSELVKIIHYTRNSYCDFCHGRLANKYRFCRLSETLCFFPLWCISLGIILLLISLSVIIYLTYFYVYQTQYLMSYTESCAVNQCNSYLGLYCKINSTNEASCSCPALALAYTCDCLSSHFWNGLTCTPVYSYGEVKRNIFTWILFEVLFFFFCKGTMFRQLFVFCATIMQLCYINLFMSYKHVFV